MSEYFVDMPAPSSLALTCAARLKPQPVRWLWYGWLARGKLHIVAGAPGTGKTTVAIALAATLTTAGRWPDGTTCAPGDVVIWSGEDDPADTLVPRLIAAGADTNRVHFVESVTEAEGKRPFSPAADLALLSATLDKLERGPALLIIDPVVSAVAGDSHKNAEVRRALQPLVELASRHGCAVLGVTHFTKNTQGRDPVERVTGSLGFGALARVVMATAKRSDEDGGGRMLARAKNNLGPDDGGFVYDFDITEPIPGIEATRVLWGDALAGSARELLASAEMEHDEEERSALDEAKDFLLDELAAGPVEAKTVYRDADSIGVSKITLKRAKKAVGVIAEKAAFSKGWRWRLPDESPEGDQETPKGLTRMSETLPGKLIPFDNSDQADDLREGGQEGPKMLTRTNGHLQEDVATLGKKDKAILARYLDRIGEHDPGTRAEFIARAANEPETVKAIRAKLGAPS